jgi:hypothetical protein
MCVDDGLEVGFKDGVVATVKPYWRQWDYLAAIGGQENGRGVLS